MFELLVSLVKWLFEAAVTYAASDEGGAGLTEILNEAEADGIDVPFYEPPEGVQGDRSGSENFNTNVSATVQNKRGKTFAERHPEITGE